MHHGIGPGKCVLDQNGIAEIGNGDEVGSKDRSARERAHRVTPRQQGLAHVPTDKPTGAGYRRHGGPGAQRPRTMALGCRPRSTMSQKPPHNRSLLNLVRTRARPRRPRTASCSAGDWSRRRSNARRTLDVTMVDLPPDVRLPKQVADVRLEGAQQQDGFPHCQRTIHLARMDDADRLGTECDQVHICSRERVLEIGERLIRQRANPGGSNCFDFPLPDPPAHEQSDQPRFLLQQAQCLEHRANWIGRSVIPTVHEHELVVEAM